MEDKELLTLAGRLNLPEAVLAPLAAAAKALPEGFLYHAQEFLCQRHPVLILDNPLFSLYNPHQSALMITSCRGIHHIVRSRIHQVPQNIQEASFRGNALS